MRILDAFSERPHSVPEIATRLDMHVRTARAYMQQLHADGWLHPIPGELRKRWTLSPAACALGARMAGSATTLAQCSADVLAVLGERSGPGVPKALPEAKRGPGRPRLHINGSAPGADAPVSPDAGHNARRAVLVNGDAQDLSRWLRPRTSGNRGQA